MKNNGIIEEWELYEAGIQYNNAILSGDKSYYEQIDVNIAFANDDQWRNVNADDISKPMIPIIQKAKQHTIANVCSSNISVTVNPMEYSANEENRTPEMQDEINTADIVNAEIRNIFDDVKIEFKIREGLGDAFDIGDACLHWYFDTSKKPFKNQNIKGKICAELVDGANIMFGNANNPNVQIQPYIIVVGRDLAINLQEEAKEYKNSIKVESDVENMYQVGDNGKIEVESDKYGKALYIIVYKKDKKTGTIKATKCTKNAYMYKDIDTELSVYPIAWFNYKKQKNQYHGRAAVTGLIPNQISVNKLLAMIIYSAMKTAFPTLIYNADKISTPTNKIGSAIPIKDMQLGESVGGMASYLQSGEIASYIITLINLIIEQTKDMLGINDAATGNVNPENTSAIALAEKLTAVPLENVKSNIFEFIEQCADIVIDMMATKYGFRPVQLKQGDNSTVVDFDFNKLKYFNLNKTTNVGSIGYTSELQSIKMLTDFLEQGKLEIVDVLERLPEYSIPKKQELIDNIKARLGIQSAEQMKENEQVYSTMAEFFDTLPQDIQAQLKALPDKEMEMQLREMMKNAPQEAVNNNQTQLNEMLGQVSQ